MFISRQTHEGLQIIYYSVIEATKYLLQQDFKFVLTERFCQDLLEEYFGRQHSIGCRNDNPTVYQFGYNNNAIRMQRSVVNVTGNTQGKYNGKRRVSWNVVEDDPLPKQKNSK